MTGFLGHSYSEPAPFHRDAPAGGSVLSESYDRLEQDLIATDEASRLRAIKQIIAQPQFDDAQVVRFVKALHTPLKDSSVEVRYYAKKAFSRLKQMVKGQGLGIILPSLLDGDLMRSAPNSPTFVYGSRDYWLHELGSVDYKLRVKAVMECCRMGGDVAFTKVMALFEKETHEHVLATLAKYVSHFRKPGVYEKVVPFLNHPDWRVRANAIEGLEGLADPRAVPLVLPFLSDQDNRVKGNAVNYLVKTQPEDVRREIGQMLSSPHEWMRDSAVFLLARMDITLSEDLLVKALGDTSPDIVKKALQVLAFHGTGDKVLGAIASLVEGAEVSLRQVATEALAAVRARSGR